MHSGVVLHALTVPQQGFSTLTTAYCPDTNCYDWLQLLLMCSLSSFGFKYQNVRQKWWKLINFWHYPLTNNLIGWFTFCQSANSFSSTWLTNWLITYSLLPSQPSEEMNTFACGGKIVHNCGVSAKVQQPFTARMDVEEMPWFVKQVTFSVNAYLLPQKLMVFWRFCATSPNIFTWAAAEVNM